MDLTTLTYDEFKHEQLKQHMAQLMWLKAMADRNTQFIMLMALFKCLEGQKLFYIPDTIMILADHYLPNFCAGRQTDTHKQMDRTDCFTPCACAWGKTLLHAVIIMKR